MCICAYCIWYVYIRVYILCTSVYSRIGRVYVYIAYCMCIYAYCIWYVYIRVHILFTCVYSRIRRVHVYIARGTYIFVYTYCLIKVFSRTVRVYAYTAYGTCIFAHPTVTSIARDSSKLTSMLQVCRVWIYIYIYMYMKYIYTTPCSRKYIYFFRHTLYRSLLWCIYVSFGIPQYT